MVALLRTFGPKVAGGGIGASMLAAMMPMAENIVGKMEPQNVQALCFVLAQSFVRVADADVSLADFEKWASELAQGNAASA